MAGVEQKNLVLILARELASNLATPIFVIDANGTLVFFNEASAAVLGQSFGEAGELEADEWAGRWKPEDDEGRPLPLDALPLMTALGARRPAHATMTIEGTDGVRRAVAVTAVPLFVTANELVGALAILWER